MPIHRTSFVNQPRTWLQLLISLMAPYLQRTESFSTIQQLHAASSATGQEVVATEYFGNEIGAELREQQNIPDNICLFEGEKENENDEEGILAALFGSAGTRDMFFKDTFGHRVAYFPRTKNSLESPISGIDLPSLYETNEWTSLRKRGSHDMLNKSEMSFDELGEYISHGGSIIIPVTPDDYLFTTKLQIERAMGVKEETGTTMNVYHSGPSAVALNIHYDAYPVFVLQLEGNKEWILQNDAFGQPVRDVTEWKNLTMTEGDLLYIPKGVFHAATTAEGYNTTTHATIGLL